MSGDHDAMGYPFDLAFLHIVPQFMWHSPAYIAGNVKGLTALRDALTAAIESGKAEASVFANDGEGYGVEITRHRCTSELGHPPYLFQMIQDGMAQERETERKLKPRKLRVNKETVE